MKRLKEGKQMVVDVEEYLEKRLDTQAPPSFCYPLRFIVECIPLLLYVGDVIVYVRLG